MLLKLLCYVFLILISVIDIHSKRIPNKLLLSLFLIRLTVLISTTYYDILKYLSAACLLFLIFYSVALFTKGFGYGDVKLLFVTSFCFGFSKSIIAVLIACLLAGLIFTFMFIHHKEISGVPFAPFITFGYLTTEIMGVAFL